MTRSDSDVIAKASSILATAYGKSYACFVASGMAAVELALEWLQVGVGRSVIVPDTVCHTVAAAVQRTGATLRFAATGSGLMPDVEAICRAVDKSTAAVIAVHQFGLPYPMRSLRCALPTDISVIEDAAQAFGVVAEGQPVGAYSDLVVTSFGPTKPLSLGGGGAVFGQEPAISGLMTRRREDFASDLMYRPRPYLLPTVVLENVSSAVEHAQLALACRRKIVADSVSYLNSRHMAVWRPAARGLPTWHRIPIEPRSATAARLLAELAKSGHLVQASHEIKTCDLPPFRASQSTHPAPAPRSHYLVRPDTFEQFLALT